MCRPTAKWCIPGWITVTQCWLVCLPICNAVFSPCSTQRLGWYNRLGLCDQITYALICLHWLRVSQRIQFKLAVLTYGLFTPATRWQDKTVLSRPCRQCEQAITNSCSIKHRVTLGLSSASPTCLAGEQSALPTPTVWHSAGPSVRSVGGRVFPVAAPTTWNDLPTCQLGLLLHLLSHYTLSGATSILIFFNL